MWLNRLTGSGFIIAILNYQPVMAAPVITHGIASGDLTDTTAIIWSRTNGDSEMTVRYQPVTGESTAKEVTMRSSEEVDYTARVKLKNLYPATFYRYEVWFSDDNQSSPIVSGTFTTAPGKNSDAGVSLIWSGDLAGQKYCRQVDVGYTIFKPMKMFRADFFVANGDMIYADNACPEAGIEKGWTNIPGDFPGISNSAVDWMNSEQVMEVYYAHWRYNREDPAFQKFLESTPMYVQWDDHEVINDFGSPWPNYAPTPLRKGYRNIVKAGLKSFFDYHPIERNPAEPDRIYRSYRWGKNLELFILDARSYRSENNVADSEQNKKTMLGAAQLDWLQLRLKNSTATWKIISSDVPLSVATGSNARVNGRDAFANGTSPFGSGPNFEETTGFETELMSLLRNLDQQNVANIVFIATDVHFAAQIRYQKDFDGDGEELLFHELISGPLSAVKSASPPGLDPTLHPTYLYAEGDIFNFGTLKVSADSLTTDIRDETGQIRPGSKLTLIAE